MMDELNSLSDIQLVKLSNDIVNKYDSLKKQVIDDTYVLDELQKKINDGITELNDLENLYTAIIVELNNRKYINNNNG